MNDSKSENATRIQKSQNNESTISIDDLMRALSNMVQNIEEILRPLNEAVDRFLNRFKDNTEKLLEVFRPHQTIEKLGEAQFVFWDALPKDFMSDIVLSENTDKTLQIYLKKGKYITVDKTINQSFLCLSNSKYKRLYDQSVKAYYSKYYDLAITGFTSVFDGLLAKVSKNKTSKFPPRIDAIKEKIEKDEFLDRNEYATLVLALTFEITLESFVEFIGFDKKEPKKLNRHWIAHGRSTRKKTKLDCVKMINIIYGILLIDQLDSEPSIKKMTK